MLFSRSGLTLIEVVVSLALVSILVLSVTFVSLMILRSWQSESIYGNQRLAFSNAAEIISNELRGALEISSAQARQINFWLDLNDNGLKEFPAEQIVFSWSGVPGTGLTRTQGATSSQEILKNIDNLSITCLTDNNQTLAYPITDLSLIRAVRVNLTSKVYDEAINLLLDVKVRNL